MYSELNNIFLYDAIRFIMTQKIPDPDEKFDFLFKIVLIGDANVGKTCIVQRFKYGTFVEKHSSTIGVDFTLKTIDVEGKYLIICYPLHIYLHF